MKAVLLVACVSLLLQAGLAASPSLEQQAHQTVDLIYNMEFDAALQAAQRVIDQAPERPAGYFFRAAAYWQWQLVIREAEQRAALLAGFWEANQQIIQVAERLPANQAAEAAFYLGAAFGMQARLHAAEKRYVAALRAARKGSTHLRRCVALDPEWHDAYLGLGLYHYALSTAPSLLQGLLEGVLAIKGDRVLGLQELERARTQGRLTVPEATSLLAKIYARTSEQQYQKAQSLLGQLVRRYPKNFDYRYRLALVEAQLRRWEAARLVLEGLIADVEQGKPYYSRQWLPLLRYRLAETYVLEGAAAAAAPLLDALRQEPLDDSLRPWVELRQGNVHDLRAEYQTARAYYQGLEDDEATGELARQYVSTPFTPRQTLIKPSEKVL